MLVQDLQELASNALKNVPQEKVQIISDAIADLKSSQLKKNVLKVGDKIEDIELKNIYDEKVLLSSLIKKDYLVISFYRGGWCPFCVLELKEYEKLRDKFLQNSANIVAISPEVSKYALETKENNTLTFDILCDENLELMKSLGIVFSLNEEFKKLYMEFGIDLEKYNNNKDFTLPIPATYVIDKNFNIVFSYIEEDYTTRFEPSKIIEFLKSL